MTHSCSPIWVMSDCGTSASTMSAIASDSAAMTPCCVCSAICLIQVNRSTTISDALLRLLRHLFGLGEVKSYDDINML